MASDIALILGQFLAVTWWLWAFFILWPLFASTWLFWRQEIFRRSNDFVLLEMRIPREVRKNPKAMEQVLAAIHSLRNAPGTLREKWWDGELTRWFSLEMATFGGEIHFYVRCYSKLRPLVEAAFFAYYPDVELVEVEDYVDRFPGNIREMYAQNYDLWGSEVILNKEAPYPIKTYLDFEAPDEEKQYDPISAFIEMFGKTKREEIVAVQLVIAPADPKWHEKWKDLVEKLKGGANAAKKIAKGVWDFEHGPLPALSIETGKTDEFGGLTKAFMRTPGETDVLKAVENNLSKPAFDTLVRVLYFSPKPIFYDSFPMRGILGAFNQYAAQNLNSFRPNFGTITKAQIWIKPYVLPKTRVEYRKQQILENFKKRRTPIQTFMGKLLTSHPFYWNFGSQRFEFTTQCLATVFHPPTYIVLTGPHVKRVPSRKTGPPAGLAIFGEEREIERYQ